MIENDAGIFLSVAGRLAHGDHLYTGVWDNKPPFFYYGQALALLLGGWRGPYALDAVWLTAACAFMGLLLRAVRMPGWVVVLGMVVYPLLLTGGWYFAGLSELPPLALAPALTWLWLRDRPLAVGGLLGILAFLRPDYVVLFAALLAVPIAARRPGRRAWQRSMGLVLVGGAAAGGASAALVAARGELSGYVDTLTSQFGYPNRALIMEGEPTGILGHIRIVARELLANNHTRGAFFILALAAVAAALVALRRRWAGLAALPDPAAAGEMLFGLLIATGVATAIIFPLEALWNHSVEPLAVPATFATCLLACELRRIRPTPRQAAVLTAAGIGVCLIGFGAILPSSPLTSGPASPLSVWWHTPHSISAAALNQEAAALGQTPVTYARLGQNLDDGQGEFIDQRLSLSCPIFQEYPFSTNLDQALACISDRRPDLVLVDPLFTLDPHPGPQIWDAFYTRGERLLHSDYTKVLQRPDDNGTLQIWKLKTLAPPGSARG
jgi:hypothetical protein